MKQAMLIVGMLMLPFRAWAAPSDLPPEAVANPAGIPVDVDLSLQFKTMHYWRGYRVCDSPMFASDLSLSAAGFRVGLWGGVGLTGAYKEFDYYASFSKWGLTVALWDIYNFSDGADGYLTTSADAFEYKSALTRHFLDLTVAYQMPKAFPLKASMSTIVYGRDRGIGPLPTDPATGNAYLTPDSVPVPLRQRNGDNRYSVYAELSFPVKTSPAELNFFVAGAFSFRDVDGRNFYTNDHRVGIVNVGLTGSRTLSIRTLKFPIALTAAVNPEWRTVAMELAIKIF